MRLEHYNIRGPMAFLREVRDFYVDIIGLTDGPRPGTTVRGFWLYAGPQAVVHLAESDAHTEPAKPGYLDHIAFSCDDYELIRQRLDEAEIPYELNRIESASLTQIFLHDPAGIRLELNFYCDKPGATS